MRTTWQLLHACLPSPGSASLGYERNALPLLYSVFFKHSTLVTLDLSHLRWSELCPSLLPSPYSFWPLFSTLLSSRETRSDRTHLSPPSEHSHCIWSHLTSFAVWTSSPCTALSTLTGPWGCSWLTRREMFEVALRTWGNIELSENDSRGNFKHRFYADELDRHLSHLNADEPARRGLCYLPARRRPVTFNYSCWYLISVAPCSARLSYSAVKAIRIISRRWALVMEVVVMSVLNV